MTSLGKFAAVVLAAGGSRRMRGEAKLLKALRGRPLLAHCLDVATSLGLSQVVVVARPEPKEMTAFISTWPVDVVRNDEPDRGMGSSIATGMAQLSNTVSGSFIVLGDMPFINAGTYRALVQAFDLTDENSICVPCYHGRMGHPVLFGRRHFAHLETLRGDAGGRSLIEANKFNLSQVCVNDRHVLIDFDDAIDFQCWHQQENAE